MRANSYFLQLEYMSFISLNISNAHHLAATWKHIWALIWAVILMLSLNEV